VIYDTVSRWLGVVTRPIRFGVISDGRMGDESRRNDAESPVSISEEISITSRRNFLLRVANLVRLSKSDVHYPPEQSHRELGHG